MKAKGYLNDVTIATITRINHYEDTYRAKQQISLEEQPIITAWSDCTGRFAGFTNAFFEIVLQAACTASPRITTRLKWRINLWLER